MKTHPLADAWLVLVLAMVFGASLAAVQAALKPRIDANKLGDTMSQVPLLVPGATRGERQLLGDTPLYRAVDAAGMPVGWVLPASGQGFADRIELLVGLDATASRITGLYVLEQKETPGLGDNVTSEPWRRQFVGKPTDLPLQVRKGKAAAPHEIEAITGATISSESVTAIVNAAVRRLREHLASGALR
ncbi:MAG: FMN-binding protein [Kiritimatiellae bacterium]|nr:FMN-binding protein [Kiritimatiellia bacterium]